MSKTDSTDPKEMYIEKNKVKQALDRVGIQCRNKKATAEYDIMDKDFRGKVRFKDFCKFVKKHKKGKAYDEIDNPSSDSSISSSEEVEMHCRAIWKNYIDPERECVLH